MHSTSQPGRIIELDALRGLAAMAVVLFHLTFWYDSYHAAPFRLTWGHYGVELFFIVSGFVIFMTLDRSRSVTDFAVSRAARLFPAYWVSVLLTSVIATLVPLSWDNSAPTAWQIAVNMTMLQRFVGVREIDNSYWTLAIELSFYFFMALAYRARALPRIERLCLAWLAAAAVARAALDVIGEHRNLGPISSVTGLFYGQFFIIGIVLYRFMRNEWSRLTLLVTVCACAMSLFGGGPYSLRTPPLTYFCLTLLLVALVGAAVNGRLPLLRWGALVWVGELSYPWYLLHQRIGAIVLRAAHESGMVSWLQVGCALASTLALAWIVHKLVEVPGRALLKSALLPRSSARSTNSAARVERLP